MSIAPWLLVGAGGFLGSALRYGMVTAFQRLTPQTGFFVGTLVVNVAGCLAIGVLAGLVEAREAFSTGTRLFLMMGVLGGFTTFSAFGYEAFKLLETGEVLRLAIYLGVSVVVGIVAVWAGMTLVRAL